MLIVIVKEMERGCREAGVYGFVLVVSSKSVNVGFMEVYKTHSKYAKRQR